MMSIAVLTIATLMAFAANSLLCRLALGGGMIDPISFAAVRLISGALVLWPVARAAAPHEGGRVGGGSWWSALALFAYAAAFSLAYLTLTTGMGALILFASVQVTMLSMALRSGERLSAAQWAGSVVAVGGLVYLVFPGLSAPDPLGALLMGVAGVAWGIYSIRGRGVKAPVAMTAGNFSRAVPFALAASIVAIAWAEMTPEGALIAVTSGALTSGLGYVLWYKALKGLTTTQASVLQLLVPVLAAIGGVMVLSEAMTARLLLASMLILGGVAVAVMARRSPSRPG
jgi:drug/metabolite transporter (DMT)-like permease